MKDILISEFKAKCIQLLKDVNKFKTPIQVTLRGEPLVIVYPVEDKGTKLKLGTLEGKIRFLDEQDNIDLASDWEMLKS